MSRLAIETQGLTKIFDGVTALDGVDLTVPEGAVFGLVGPNGAGKTTLIRTLMGILRPTAGTVRILGRDCFEGSGEVRQQVGYVPDEPVLYPSFRVEEMLQLCSRLYRHWDWKRCEELLERFQLPRNRWILSLSKGMKTRLALAIALSVRPRLLILDEPAGGLDPVVKHQMLGLVLEEVAEHGTTVLISTHQLEDLERIADHVAVMKKGRCLLTRTVEDLRKEARKIQAVFPEGLPEAVRRMPGILHVESQGRVYTLTVGNGFDTVLEAVKAHRPVYVETVSLGLEEWFIRTVEKEGMKDGAVSAE
ncbi:MAG: hypothetical protein CW342_03215 [Thermoactinomycetaceae bacterium]|nr:hypothetical protein [Bacillota bacterium]MBO2531900.1 hypothetical protein [Thermoactinomycetaceae bacterium]